MSIVTTNDFAIGGNLNGIGPMLPLVIKTREQAYRTAAWILSLSSVLRTEGDGSQTFEEVLEAVENT